MRDVCDFLPVSKEDMEQRGMWWYDFLLVTGDAYVDHPSFGPAVIGRVLEADGFRIAMLAQPDWRSVEPFRAMGRPRLGVLICSGNLDSMVAHYTAAKKRRSEDFYSPGKRAGLRPDRALIVYANRAREAFGDIPVVIGGLEASLRRFAHYDYWDDAVRRSELADAGADILSYGMGEYSMREIALRLKAKEPLKSITDIRGTAVMVSDPSLCAYESVTLPSFEEVRDNKRAYAEATRIEYEEHDPIRGRALIQKHGEQYLVVNPPAMPLSTEELDRVAELPYTREYHPMYEPMGGVPAIEEVRFSVIHNRGCFGGCSFCALAFHQGRMVTSRSHESIIREVIALTKFPDFKGYINDVGGPSANFRHPSCKKQLQQGMCPDRRCLAPEPCPNLDADHSDYLELLRKLRKIDGVKKVFVRSGIRYDYMLEDRSSNFFRELVEHHISGQLKVAPEYCVDSVLDYMGKPHIGIYEQFLDRYRRLNQSCAKEQFVVPYLMSSHPGSTLESAIELALYLKKTGRRPEQVQDFYPTPGTLSTCMYHTGLDPMSMKPVYVAKSPEEKAMQRALLQYTRADRRKTVIEALKAAGREDLIGYESHCLVRPLSGRRKAGGKGAAPGAGKSGGGTPRGSKASPAARERETGKKPGSKKGRAKPKKTARPGKNKRSVKIKK